MCILFVTNQFIVVNIINVCLFNVANRADLALDIHGALSSKLVNSLWYINDRHNTARRRPSFYSGIPRSTLYQHKDWFRVIWWLERVGYNKLLLKSNIIDWSIVHNKYLNAMTGTTNVHTYIGICHNLVIMIRMSKQINRKSDGEEMMKSY